MYTQGSRQALGAQPLRIDHRRSASCGSKGFAYSLKMGTCCSTNRKGSKYYAQDGDTTSPSGNGRSSPGYGAVEKPAGSPEADTYYAPSATPKKGETPSKVPLLNKVGSQEAAKPIPVNKEIAKEPAKKEPAIAPDTPPQRGVQKAESAPPADAPAEAKAPTPTKKASTPKTKSIKEKKAASPKPKGKGKGKGAPGKGAAEGGATDAKAEAKPEPSAPAAESAPKVAAADGGAEAPAPGSKEEAALAAKREKNRKKNQKRKAKKKAKKKEAAAAQAAAAQH